MKLKLTAAWPLAALLLAPSSCVQSLPGLTRDLTESLMRYFPNANEYFRTFLVSKNLRDAGVERQNSVAGMLTAAAASGQFLKALDRLKPTIRRITEDTPHPDRFWKPPGLHDYNWLQAKARMLPLPEMAYALSLKMATELASYKDMDNFPFARLRFPASLVGLLCGRLEGARVHPDDIGWLGDKLPPSLLGYQLPHQKLGNEFEGVKKRWMELREAKGDTYKLIFYFMAFTARVVYSDELCLWMWDRMPELNTWWFTRDIIALHPECAKAFNDLLRLEPFSPPTATATVVPYSPMDGTEGDTKRLMMHSFDDLSLVVFVYGWSSELLLLAEDVALVLLWDVGESLTTFQLFEQVCMMLRQRPWRQKFEWQDVKDLLTAVAKDSPGYDRMFGQIDRCDQKGEIAG